jgi:hypothetical protein
MIKYHHAINMRTPKTVSPTIMAGVMLRPVAPTSERRATVGIRPKKFATKKRRPSIALNPAT